VLDPSVRSIFASAANFDAVAAFDGLHKLQALRRKCEEELAKVDALLLPTAPRTFTVEQMLADPIAHNAQLGIYTNFCNLLGLCAIAVPAGFSPDGQPFGVTLVGPAFADEALAPLAQRLHLAARCGSGVVRKAALPKLRGTKAPAENVEVAVLGAHLTGMPLNRELLELEAQLVARTRTAPDYRLFLLPRTSPAKPGLIRMPDWGGEGIELEVWSMSAQAFGRFASAIPAPLGIGKIVLADGREVSGFLCEAWAVEDAEEITGFGGWRAYVNEREAAASSLNKTVVAADAADARFSTPTLMKICSRCLFTVRALMFRISLISLFDLPRDVHKRTSASRGVRLKASRRSWVSIPSQERSSRKR
jgi:allophanate hydrolase